MWELLPESWQFKPAAIRYTVPVEASQERLKHIKHFITSERSFFLGIFVIVAAVWYFPIILLRKVSPRHSETKATLPALQTVSSCC